MTLLSYRERVLERNSHKVTRNAESFSHVGQPGLWSTGLAPALFCWLSCSVLLSAFFGSALGPSFPRPLPVSWEISCASLLCRFCAKADKGIFWLALTHTHTANAHIASQNSSLPFLFLYVYIYILIFYRCGNLGLILISQSWHRYLMVMGTYWRFGLNWFLFEHGVLTVLFRWRGYLCVRQWVQW